MAVEYRPVRPDELREFAYNGQAAFGRSTAADELAAYSTRMRAEIPPEWTLCAFDDGELASKMLTLPLGVYWNGREIDCGGVAGVTTLPTHRRRGYLRELTRRAFATMRERGQPLAMLWASMAAIYQRFGYAVGSAHWSYRFDPRELRFVDEIPVCGRVRLVRGADPSSVIGDAYERFAAARTLMLRRDREVVCGKRWWADRLERWDGAPPFLIAAYEEDGRVLGYVIYAVAEHREWRPGPDQELLVSDLVWLTPAAHRALIRYLCAYDLARSIRIAPLPTDDPLFYQAQEPRLLNVEVGDGALVRIVEIQAALEGRGYIAAGRLRLGIEDELCPWNSGVWELVVEEGAARLQRSAREPELALTPRALATLASGQQSATTLARIGLIPPASAHTLAAADALFHTACAPLCLDHF